MQSPRRRHPLTPRRAEALEVLRRLSTAAGGGVHYTKVGAEMGISAWTAYGLLRELEGAGLADRSYALAMGIRLGGRSRILFSPAATVNAPSDLPDRLRRSVERFAAFADEATAVRAYLADTLPGAGGDLATHLGFWMTRLQAAGRNATEAMRGVLESSAVPAVKIQTLAAMGLGTELGELGRTLLAERTVAVVTRLAGRLEEAQRSSDTALAGLVDAARAIVAAGAPRPRTLTQ